jgi:hypothetical protein
MRFLESTDVLQTLIGWLRRGVSVLRAIGPYAAIELLLPGGSLMALALWLVQRKARKKTPMRIAIEPFWYSRNDRAAQLRPATQPSNSLRSTR